jgi:hypothetical protein
MKEIVMFISILIFMPACEEVISPKVERTNSSLAVEGMMSTIPGRNSISITNSNPYNDPKNLKRVAGLKVYTIDNQGNRIDFEETNNNGLYTTGNDSTKIAKIGNTYTLFITSPDGDVYKSTPQYVSECPEIDKIFIDSDQETILTEDNYGKAIAVNVDGITVFSNTKAILPKNNYYLFRWYGFVEHYARVTPPGSTSYELFRHTILSSLYTKVICTGNADESYDLSLRRKKFVFIPENAYMDYNPEIPEGYILENKTFEGILFATEQYSISEDSYNFWHQAEQQLEASNKLFNPITTQIKGNLTCVSNPEKKIYGVFCATDSKIRYDYLFINHRHLTYNVELDSLPDIYIDTNSPLSNWIFPPI